MTVTMNMIPFIFILHSSIQCLFPLFSEGCVLLNLFTYLMYLKHKTPPLLRNGGFNNLFMASPLQKGFRLVVNLKKRLTRIIHPRNHEQGLSNEHYEWRITLLKRF
jgi:hypothetical protein